MQHFTFGNSSFHTAILIKSASMSETSLKEHYSKPLSELGYDVSGLVGFSLTYDKKKPSAACRNAYLADLLPALVNCGVKYLICADGEYFKTLVKSTKAEPHLGAVLPCAIEGFENLQVIYALNYRSYFADPRNKDKTQLSLQALVDHSEGNYSVLGADVLKSANYPKTEADIASWLNELHKHPVLTCDIEAFSLKHFNAGIGTISFAWNKHEGIAFTVDAKEVEPYQKDVWDKKDKKFKTKTFFLKQVVNENVRKLLKDFFESYEGRIMYHNISYDGVVLTYQLWMKDVLDRVGLKTGREIILKNFDCTQLITFLAVNSCAGNRLSLKEQAHEFAGNYAIEVTDIRLQPLDKLLEYNLIDSCSTWFVFEKNYPIMEKDDQLEIYETRFKVDLWDIFEMHLTGLCLDLERVSEVKHILEATRNKSIYDLKSTPVVKRFIQDSRELEVKERNLAYKKKVITVEDATFELNINSPKQLQSLIYTYLNLPILDTTPTGQPATGADTLTQLSFHAKTDEAKQILEAIIEFSKVEKILSSFITAFERDHFIGPDGVARIYGSFKLGGTLSGRLSSSNPNIQQIPSGSTYGKLIKSCFIAPPNMVFGMSDFDALEDVINTLLTKDPAKERVLIQGYDGHSYRCYSFWKEKFPHINPDDPKSINSIKLTNDSERSDAKPVHFALQYLGTAATLVANCGFSLMEATQIEQRYQELYKVSFAWVNDRIQQASKDGYAIAAFGLRIRAPLLNQVILGNQKTPQEAQAEARSLGNAISGQSYGLLNGRASAEFMQRVRESEFTDDIWLAAQIHDALYFYWTDSIEVTAWVNKHLIECMAWNELPELQHPQIKLSSALDIAYPTWADPITIPNGAGEPEIIECLKAERIKRKGA